MEKRNVRGFVVKKLWRLSFVLTIAFTLILFSGCGIYDQIDLEKVKKTIVDLKEEEVDLLKIKQVLESTAYFESLEEIEFSDLKDLEIDLEYIEKKDGKPIFLFEKENRKEINSVSVYSYMIVKSAEDKKELLENQIDLYYQNVLENDLKQEDLPEVLKEEYEGYLIYILSDHNEEILQTIKENSHPLLFGESDFISLEEFVSSFGLNENQIIEFQAVVPVKENVVDLYVIVKPKHGQIETVRKSMDSYFNTLEKKWSTYLPEEYQLVKNRMKTEVGSYFVYIISKDNETVLKTIKDAIVKKDH